MNLRSYILEKAAYHGVMIACAESCSGGMLAAALTDLPGSSAVFDRGFVTYSNSAKQDLLGVSPTTLQKFGAVSEETAREMAQGALQRSAAHIALSITGIAGPGGSDHKPEGLVCFGLATTAELHSETCTFGPLGRDKVRLAARDQALGLIAKTLSELPKP